MRPHLQKKRPNLRIGRGKRIFAAKQLILIMLRNGIAVRTNYNRSR